MFPDVSNDRYVFIFTVRQTKNASLPDPEGEDARSSETSGTVAQTTRRHVSEDVVLQCGYWALSQNYEKRP